MLVDSYLDRLAGLERRLAAALRAMALRPRFESSERDRVRRMAGWSVDHAETLAGWAARFPHQACGPPGETDRSREARPGRPRGGDPDLHLPDLAAELDDLIALATRVRTAWAIFVEAARDLGDEALAAECGQLAGQTERQLAWLAGQAGRASSRTLEPSHPG